MKSELKLGDEILVKMELKFSYGMPRSVLLRDWEGFRLIQGSALLNKMVATLSQRAAQHLTYSRQNAW